MIIRSQDKKAIANFDNIDSIGIEQNHCGCDVVGYNGTRESCVKLGEYSAEEKTIKVLDMIQEKYLNCNRESMAGCFGFVKNTVFQMPADEEV